MAIVLSEEWLYVVIFVWISGRIVNRFGGVTIAYYRLRHIAFFTRGKIEPGGNITKKTYPMKALQHHSPLGFEEDDGLYFAGGPNDTAQYMTGPYWLYQHGDARPLPVMKMDAGRLEPNDIIKPFKSKSEADLHRITEKRSKVQTGAIVLLAILIMVMVAATLYYTYYFGLNIACATHSSACITGGHP